MCFAMVAISLLSSGKYKGLLPKDRGEQRQNAEDREQSREQRRQRHGGPGVLRSQSLNGIDIGDAVHHRPGKGVYTAGDQPAGFYGVGGRVPPASAAEANVMARNSRPLPKNTVEKTGPPDARGGRVPRL